jgi:hypothetical protein
MAKKNRDNDNDGEDFDDELENSEYNSDNIDDESESDSDSESDSESESEFDLGDDCDEIDIVIEIDDEDLLDDTTKPSEEDDIVLSKHKIDGKHSLKYDSIFKGKKEDPLSEDELDGFAYYHKETIEVDKSSNYYFESIDNESYIRSKLVKEKVYEVLVLHTELNFMNNRRKPSRVDFNHYYFLLKQNLENESFTNVELFNELSVYFSDNLFNMFKLLDNKWRNLIINELQDHIGKNLESKQIMNRNIYEGTEIEFIWEDEFGSDKLITGVVLITDYDSSSFKVDSYENIYDIHISRITKILNNEKFKYNLNKLNNIDFL